MSDKYLQGAQKYHLVAEGSDETKCGQKLGDTQFAYGLAAAKSHGSWPTCAMCTLAPSEETLDKVRPNRKK